MRFPGFIGPSYQLQSVNVDAQRCVNLYPERNELGTGKEGEQWSLVATPGLRALVTLPTLPVRGTYTASTGVLYAVGGAKLYSITDAWVATELGTLETASGPVSMADNGISLMLVDGAKGYAVTLAGGAFATITDEDFPTAGADQVTYMDGYFIFNESGSQRFFISDLNSTAIDALDFANALGNPDPLIGLVAAYQNLYLFGTRSTEVFYNTGDAEQPFQRQSGAVLEQGCVAAFTIQPVAGSICWLGQDSGGYGIVYRSEGYQAKRISTVAVESVIRSVDPDRIGDARAWTYQQGGHPFYCVNLPGIASTWCYDGSTGMWHERAYLSQWGLQRHRADCSAVAYGVNVVGDYQTGKLYALDGDTYTDDGASVVRLRRSPHVSSTGKTIRHNAFRLDVETGVGLASGQGSAPLAMLRWSDDGGHTWSTERTSSIGAQGKYKTRAIWRRLGQARDRVYEASIADPVKVVMVGAEIELEEGAS